MTGFGKASAQIPGKKITVELKSLNSKQFDMQTRIPSAYRELELEMRRKVAQHLERGKIDLTISVETLGMTETTMKIDTATAASYMSQIRHMQQELGLPEPADWYALLLRLPEVLHSESNSELGGDETKAVFEALDGAIEGLMNHRREEGKKLEEFFATRLRNITDLLKEIPRWEKERIDRIYSRMEDALSSLSNEQIDRGRLEQEMIFYIEKLDVNEERQRLGQHLVYFAETMANPAPGQGKKLGFISQEMGREINTLGSKSNHAEMQKQVVKMKDELEQIKEQVLNVM